MSGKKVRFPWRVPFIVERLTKNQWLINYCFLKLPKLASLTIRNKCGGGEIPKIDYY